MDDSLNKTSLMDKTIFAFCDIFDIKNIPTYSNWILTDAVMSKNG